jgi:hypothetical protein
VPVVPGLRPRGRPLQLGHRLCLLKVNALGVQEIVRTNRRKTFFCQRVNGMPFSKLRRKRKKYNNVIAETIDIIECCTYILSSEILYGLKRHFFWRLFLFRKAKKRNQSIKNLFLLRFIPWCHTYIHILQTLQTLDVVIFTGVLDFLLLIFYSILSAHLKCF